jgi:hypothetical protein
MSENLPASLENLPAEIDSMTRDQIRDLIATLESNALDAAAVYGGVEVPIEHYFSKGVYAREMKVPAGSVIVGKIHRFENLNILSAGEVSVFSIDGCKRVKAPFTFVASPGAKRFFYVHTDATWTVIHGTDETDIEKIESEFIAKNYEELSPPKGDKCLGSP